MPRRSAHNAATQHICKFIFMNLLLRDAPSVDYGAPREPEPETVDRGGNMKLAMIMALACITAGAAFAGEIAPKDVVQTEGAVEASLTGAPGDAATGAKVMANRAEGNCVACHQVSALKAAFQGDVGPSLDGTGERWSEAQLRGMLVNPKMTFEGTVMPAFYKVDGFIRPGDGYTGKPATEITPVLTAQQIEDVVAFLITLKE
jgi:sulfur-oxidizing protein SoxX